MPKKALQDYTTAFTPVSSTVVKVTIAQARVVCIMRHLVTETHHTGMYPTRASVRDDTSRQALV